MSSKFDHKKVMPRYSAIAIIMTIFAIAVVGKALYIMTAKHDYWMKVAERQKKDSVTVKAKPRQHLELHRTADGKFAAGV